MGNGWYFSVADPQRLFWGGDIEAKICISRGKWAQEDNAEVNLGIFSDIPGPEGKPL